MSRTRWRFWCKPSFGPAGSGPDCHVHLGSVLFLVVTQYRCLGVVLTPMSRTSPAVTDCFINRAVLPISFVVSVFDTYVLSSAGVGLEFGAPPLGPPTIAPRPSFLPSATTQSTSEISRSRGLGCTSS